MDTRNEFAHLCYIMYVYTLITGNSYYTTCILFYRVIFFIVDRNITSYVLQYIFKYKRYYIILYYGVIHQYYIGLSNSINILGNISLKIYTKNKWSTTIFIVISFLLLWMTACLYKFYVIYSKHKISSKK